MKKSVFFVGIGGSGMSGIARLMNMQGHRISGSDREFDRGNQAEFFRDMLSSGIHLFRQDGSGIHSSLDMVVTSTAVEASIPDICSAREMGLPIRHRSEALADIIHAYRSIAVAGTSGKSTVTGMCAWSLKNSGCDPTVINGARVIDLAGPGQDSDILAGHGELAVFEADESDGSLVRFRPAVGILTNITKDHLPLVDLVNVFTEFVHNIRELLIFNSDCSVTRQVAAKASSAIGFGLHSDADFRMSDILLEDLASSCSVEGVRLQIRLPGLHNLQNAMAAYSLLRHLGKSPGETSQVLESFRGIQRRFQITGDRSGITVVDDFAHNPDKIRATMKVAQRVASRVIYIFQPHGFGPTRFLFNEITDQFGGEMRSQDVLILMPIFYAGGTTRKDISSEDLADRINSFGKTAEVISREAIPGRIGRLARAGDWVILMGARDPTLPELARNILATIPESPDQS